MKIREILNLMEEIEKDTISEFRYGSLPNADIPEDTILDKNHVGEREGHHIYHFSWKGHHGLGTFNEDGTYQGYILLHGTTDPFIFGQAYVRKEYRKRGICSCLILFVLRDFNNKIMIAPDEIITEDSRTLFKKLLYRGLIKMTNTVDNKVVDYPTLEQMFRSIGSNNIGFIVENTAAQTFGKYYEIVNPERNNATHGGGDSLIEAYYHD